MKLDAWHCAGWSSELGDAPLGRKLLGHDVVLFRDTNGTARALGARCPHRGADLAQGSLVGGCIQCPFHGWRFDGAGQCVRVPSQPEDMKIPPLARVPIYAVHERDGTVWLRLSGGDTPREPALDPEPVRARSARRLCFAPRLIDAPCAYVVENFFDKAHAPFIHTGTFGAGQDTLVARQRVTVEADARGLHAEDDPDAPWQVAPKLPRGLTGLLGRLFFGLRTPVAQHARFALETGAQLYVEYPNGLFDLFRARITPADESHTWLFVESLRTRAAHAVGDWIQRRAIARLFDEGARETSLILAGGAAGDPHPVSVESDRLGLAARHLYERWVQGGATTPIPSLRPL